jgi:subtilisin-like proprotein convertase family protein
LCLLALAGALPGADLLPDLIVDGPSIATEFLIDRSRIPGATLLRMPTVIPNIGQGPLEIRGGEANSDGSQNVYQRIQQSDGTFRERLAGTFVFHPMHAHTHFEDFAHLRLRARNPDGSVGSVVREGAKISFCLVDIQAYDLSLPGAPAARGYSGCGPERQGISVGWADVYDRNLDDQWVDITGVTPGEYWVEVITDPSNSMLESNESNNSAFIPYTVEDVDNSIAGVIYNDLNVNGERNDGEPGLAGWEAYIDLDENGIRDSTFTTVEATEVPVDIIDQRKALHTMTVANAYGVILDLNIKVRLTHTFLNDLALTLISPSGRRVLLVDDTGGSNDNFTDTEFTDEGTMSIRDGTAPFTGKFRPLERLSFFDGQSPNGIWKLEIHDQAGGDAGRLEAWSLIIAHAEPAANTDSSGAYRIGPWADQTVTVRAVRKIGWVGPTPASHVVELTGGPFGARDFGFWRENKVLGTVFEDIDGDGVRDPGEPGLRGWRIYDDANNNGVFDGGLGTLERAATDLPLPISDLSTTVSGIMVAGVVSPIRDIDVSVDLTHTFLGDLTLTLVNPDGMRVVLFDRFAGASDNLTGTTFSDDAAIAISGGSPPYTGVFRPVQPLSSLFNATANGSWSLEVEDHASMDTGTLNSWSLRFVHGEETTTSDPDGNFALLKLRPGTYRIRQVPRAGWIQTAPPGGVYEFSFTSAGEGTALFGNQRVPPLPLGNG